MEQALPAPAQPEHQPRSVREDPELQRGVNRRTSHAGAGSTRRRRLSITLRAVAVLILVAGFAVEAAAQCTLPLGHTPPELVIGTVTVEAREESLRVSWNAVTGADRYVVEWKSGSEVYGSAREATVSGTSYTIGGLTPGTEYTVRVFPATRVNLASSPEEPEVWAVVCSSTPSTEVSGTPDAPLGQVTGVMVKPGVRSLDVSWSAVADADGYKVQWKRSGEDYDPTRRQAVTTVTATDPGTSYTIPDLDPGTKYTVRVIATRARADDGPPSDEVTVTTRRLPAVQPPMPGRVPA